MNLFTRVEEILSSEWGTDHLKYVEKLLEELGNFMDSEFFDNEEMRNAAIDEFIEFLKTKKTTPKGNDHA